MNILFIRDIMITGLYYFRNCYKERVDFILKNMNLTTFNAIRVAYIKAFTIGGLLMTIIS
jgi:hypothetical protein